MKFDLEFVLRDCGGDVAKAQKRIDRYAREIRNEALEEAAKAAEAAKCGSDTPWDCGCDPGIKAIRSLAASAKEEKLK